MDTQQTLLKQDSRWDSVERTGLRLIVSGTPYALIALTILRFVGFVRPNWLPGLDTTHTALTAGGGGGGFAFAHWRLKELNGEPP